MVKYSYELKRLVIQDYLDGFEGLKRKRRKRSYSCEFKLHAIEYYLSKDIYYHEAANQFVLDAPPLLTAWVLNLKTRESGKL